MRIEEIKKYIAADGEEFDNERDCIKHEEESAYILVTDIPHVVIEADELYDGSSCNLYAFFKVETEDQAFRIVKWAVIMGCKNVPMDAKKLIGATVAVDCFNSMDDTIINVESVYRVETISQYVARFIDRVYNVANSIPVGNFYRDKEKSIDGR